LRPLLKLNGLINMSEYSHENFPAGPPAAEKEVSEEVKARIKEKLGFETDFAFTIENELDENGNQINAEIYWVRFPTPLDSNGNPENPPVEGKVYFPKENSNDRLVFFAPGSPGGDAGRVERKHAKTLVEAGNTFVTIRHNGQGFLSEKAQGVFNSPERIKLLQDKGQEYLGQDYNPHPDGFTWDDLTREQITVLQDCAPKFQNIVAICHSLGATGMYRSIGLLAKSHPEIVEKISKIIALAGFMGKESPDEPETNFWQGIKMSFDDFVAEEMAGAVKDDAHYTSDPVRFGESAKKVTEELKDLQLPDHIVQILATAPYDQALVLPVIKYTSEENGQEYMQATDYPAGVGKNNILAIEDHTEPEKKTHSMLGVHPDTLLRLVDMKVSTHGPHFVKVYSKETKEQKAAQ